MLTVSSGSFSCGKIDISRISTRPSGLNQCLKVVEPFPSDFKGGSSFSRSSFWTFYFQQVLIVIHRGEMTNLTRSAKLKFQVFEDQCGN